MAGHGASDARAVHLDRQTALSRIRRRLQRGRTQTWYSNLGEDDRDHARSYGRRLVTLVSEYLTKGSNRAELLDEARDILHEYGALMFRDGLSLRDVLEGFTFFRKTLDETAMEEAQKNDLTADKVLEMWEHLSNLADQVLLSIAESYDEAAMATPAGQTVRLPCALGECATTRYSSTSQASRSSSSAAATSRTRRWRPAEGRRRGHGRQPRTERRDGRAQGRGPLPAHPARLRARRPRGVHARLRRDGRPRGELDGRRTRGGSGRSGSTPSTTCRTATSSCPASHRRAT